MTSIARVVKILFYKAQNIIKVLRAYDSVMEAEVIYDSPYSPKMQLSKNSILRVFAVNFFEYGMSMIIFQVFGYVVWHVKGC